MIRRQPSQDRLNLPTFVAAPLRVARPVAGLEIFTGHIRFICHTSHDTNQIPNVKMSSNCIDPLRVLHMSLRVTSNFRSISVMPESPEGCPKGCAANASVPLPLCAAAISGVPSSEKTYTAAVPLFLLFSSLLSYKKTKLRHNNISGTVQNSPKPRTNNTYVSRPRSPAPLMCVGRCNTATHAAAHDI